MTEEGPGIEILLRPGCCQDFWLLPHPTLLFPQMLSQHREGGKRKGSIIPKSCLKDVSFPSMAIWLAVMHSAQELLPPAYNYST